MSTTYTPATKKRGENWILKNYVLRPKTRDRKLADRRLCELRAKVDGLRTTADAKLTFAQAGKMWLEADKHALSTSTVKRREMYIKGLLPYFQDIPFAMSPIRIATAG